MLKDILVKNVSIGDRIGHEESFRKWAVTMYGADMVALASESRLKELMLKDGYIPVVICGHEDESETIYIISQSD